MCSSSISYDAWQRARTESPNLISPGSYRAVVMHVATSGVRDRRMATRSKIISEPDKFSSALSNILVVLGPAFKCTSKAIV